MCLRLFRRLAAFFIKVFVVACFGWLIGFVYDANTKKSAHEDEPLDSLISTPLKIEEFLNSEGEGSIILSAADIKAFVNELYYRDALSCLGEPQDFSSPKKNAAPLMRLPSFSIEDGLIRMSVFVAPSPVLFSSAPRISFFIGIDDGQLAFKSARTGNARIPQFIAKPMFLRIIKEYDKSNFLNKFGKRLSLLKDMRIENNQFILTR